MQTQLIKLIDVVSDDLMPGKSLGWLKNHLMEEKFKSNAINAWKRKRMNEDIEGKKAFECTSP